MVRSVIEKRICGNTIQGSSSKWGKGRTGIRVEFGVVEVVDDVFDGLDGPVPGIHFISLGSLSSIGTWGVEGKRHEDWTVDGRHTS